jgi:hypothetical protein
VRTPKCITGIALRLINCITIRLAVKYLLGPGVWSTGRRGLRCFVSSPIFRRFLVRRRCLRRGSLCFSSLSCFVAKSSSSALPDRVSNQTCPLSGEKMPPDQRDR